jgi:putative toxin-antitoxin system antitoxin component (TIGR02293 family)
VRVSQERGTSVGVKAQTSVELIRQLEAGLPFQTIEALREALQISIESIALLTRIPERTLARRKSDGKLSLEESERVLRLATVFERAVDLFDGDQAAANRWLKTPRRAFGGKAALEFAETEVGAAEVRDLIGRIEHGVIS